MGVLVAALAGVVVGVFCALVPGLHTNLVATAILFLPLDVLSAGVFVCALGSARSVADAVPSVFLGASDDALALHPAQRMARQGFGLLAVKCSVLGSLGGLCLAALLVPVMMLVFPVVFELAQPVLFWILLSAIIVLIFQEKHCVRALVWFLVCGVFGVVALDSVREPLFPLLSGMFGGSGLLLGVLSGVGLPVQAFRDRKVPLRVWGVPVGLGVLAGAVLTVLPGLGASQAAALVQLRKIGVRSFLALTGALGTIDLVISLVVFSVLGRSRSGAIVAIEVLFGNVSVQTLCVLLGVCVFAGGVSVALSLWLAREYARLARRVDMVVVRGCVLGLLCVSSRVVSGGLGTLVFVIAVALGVCGPVLRVSRSLGMGVLLVPTLAWLW